MALAIRVEELGDTVRGGGGDFWSTGLKKGGEEEGPEKKVQKRVVSPANGGDLAGGSWGRSMLLLEP